MHVTLLDLGMGNLRSVHNALLRAGATRVSITSDPTSTPWERVVLPGQGHFQDGSAMLDAGFRDALLEFFATERPFLGLCLGMQLLFEGSDEAPAQKGLGLLAGRLQRFRPSGALKVPHMGWNEVTPRRDWIEPTRYYFVHSYRAACSTALDPFTAGVTQHGEDFIAAVARGNVWATQFHPEKSAQAGARLLTRWLRQ